MRPGTAIRAAALAGLLLLGAVPSFAENTGQPTGNPPSQANTVAGEFSSRKSTVPLGVGKSVVVDFPRDIKDVLVGDPKVANAVIRSSRRVYILGLSAGETNIFFFDGDGNQMAGYDLEVTERPAPTPSRVVDAITNAIAKFIPGSAVKAESVGDGIILWGTVANQVEAQQAYDIASHFVAPNNAFNTGANNGGSPLGAVGAGTNVSVGASPAGLPTGQRLNGVSASKIVNMIVVRGRDQIMLKVVVAEVERDLIKQLGINLQGTLGYGTAVINFNNTNPFTAYGQSLSGSSISAGWKSLT
jgi:pilus assembly protein CpaC